MSDVASYISVDNQPVKGSARLEDCQDLPQLVHILASLGRFSKLVGPKIEFNVGKNKPPNFRTITHNLVLQLRKNS